MPSCNIWCVSCLDSEVEQSVSQPATHTHTQTCVVHSPTPINSDLQAFPAHHHNINIIMSHPTRLTFVPAALGVVAKQHVLRKYIDGNHQNPGVREPARHHRRQGTRGNMGRVWRSSVSCLMLHIYMYIYGDLNNLHAHNNNTCFCQKIETACSIVSDNKREEKKRVLFYQGLFIIMMQLYTHTSATKQVKNLIFTTNHGRPPGRYILL